MWTSTSWRRLRGILSFCRVAAFVIIGGLLLVANYPALGEILATPISQAPTNAKIALVIGIDNYKSVEPLEDSNNDADAFANLLKTKMGFSNVVLMTDDQDTPASLIPTYMNIRRQMSDLLAGIQPSTQVVVFFSGHGIRATDSTGGDADWLVPEDADPNDIKETCINYSEFKSDLETAQPARAILVIDACRNVLSGKGLAPSSGFGGTEENLPQIAELLSCQPNQLSYEGSPADFHEGVFTHFVVAGLSGDKDALAPGTNTVTFDSLLTYVRSEVSDYVQTRLNSTQTPDGSATLGSMVLATVQPETAVPPIVQTETDTIIPPAGQSDTSTQPVKPGTSEANGVSISPSTGPTIAPTLSSDASDSPATQYYQQGVQLIGSRQYPGAEQAFRQAADISPKNPTYQDEIGISLQQQRRYREAETYFKSAVQMDPRNPEYLDDYGELLLLEDKYPDAEGYLSQAVSNSPGNPLYRDDLGQALDAEGKSVEALAAFQQAVKLAPSNEAYRDDLQKCLGEKSLSTEKQIVTTPLDAVPSAAKIALVIGIDNYQHAPPLGVCANDAHRFANLLEHRLGFSTGNVIVMTDESTTKQYLQPTYINIYTQLQYIEEQVQQNFTQVVFFFSGHGTHLNDDDYLIPVDGRPEWVDHTCENLTEFVAALQTKQPARALIFTDACRNLDPNHQEKDVYSNQFGSGNGVADPEFAELLSCQPGQISRVGKTFPESVFTHFLIEGLMGDASALDPGSKRVTYDSLKKYVRDAVYGYVKIHYDTLQIPIGQASAGYMVLAKFSPPAAGVTGTGK